MLELIIKVVAAIITTEAITEIVVKSELFEPVRKLLFESKYKILNFIHKILDCGYCFSVWASLITVLALFIINNIIIDFLIVVIVVHRLSNLVHSILDKVQT